MVLIVLAASEAGACQNLVPNGSFEEYTECPDFWAQTERATGWSAFRNSPDYFNACEPTGYWSVPHNVVGYQLAATGQAYCGMYTWCPGGLVNQEHFGAELLSPLEPGVPVNISFKFVNTANGFIESMGYAVSGFGVLFTMEPYYIVDQVPLPDHAALLVDSAYSDTMEWREVSGTFIPDSAYRYIVIGGMFQDALIQIDTIDPAHDFNCAYAYIDDVCVTPYGGECLFSDGIKTGRISGIVIAPNPCGKKLMLIDHNRLGRDDLWLRVADTRGRVFIERLALAGVDGALDMEALPFGPLVVSIGGDSGLLKETLVIHLEP